MAALPLGLLAPAAWAETALGVGYRGEWSSNIARVPSGGESEWANILALGLSYADFTPEWRARVSAVAERRDYRHDRVPDESLYDVEAAAVWWLSAQRLTWSLENRYAQVLRDTRDPAISTNRVGANAASTGPDFYARLAPRQLLRLGARYVNVYFGQSVDDYQRVSGYARYLYEPTAADTLSFNLEYGQTDFDEEVTNVNYRRLDAFLRWETRQGRSGYSVDLGTTRLDRQRGDDAHGSLARFHWRRQLTSESAFGVTVAREFLDTAGALLASVTPAEAVLPVSFGEGISTTVASGDLYYLRRAEFFYRRTGTRLGLEARAFRRDYDYEALAVEDRRENGAALDIVFNRGGTLFSGLFADWLKTEYDLSGREDRDLNAGARLGYRATPRLSGTLEASRLRRTSSDPTAEYLERRYTLSLFYTWGVLPTRGLR
jgi:hypothetical protein